MERTILGEEDRRDRLVAAAIKTATLGQVVATVLAFTLVIAAITLMWRGQTVAGGILLSVPAVLLVRTLMGDSKGDGGTS